MRGSELLSRWMITGMGFFKKIYCQESMYSMFEGKLQNSSLSITNSPPHLRRELHDTYRTHLAGTLHTHFLLHSLYKDSDRKSELHSVTTQLKSRLRSSGGVALVQIFTLNTEARESSETSESIGHNTRCCMTTE